MGLALLRVVLLLRSSLAAGSARHAPPLSSVASSPRCQSLCPLLGGLRASPPLNNTFFLQQICFLLVLGVTYCSIPGVFQCALVPLLSAKFLFMRMTTGQAQTIAKQSDRIRTARNSREELMNVASVHDSVGPCSPDRTTRSMEAHLHGEKRFCIISGSSFSVGSPFMVEMTAVEPDCVRDPGSTQDRTKSSTNCLSEQTKLLEFRDGITSSSIVLLMTNIAVSSSNMRPSQKKRQRSSSCIITRATAQANWSINFQSSWCEAYSVSLAVVTVRVIPNQLCSTVQTLAFLWSSTRTRRTTDTDVPATL